MAKEEKRIPLYLQNIVDDIPFGNLPAKWQGFDFVNFSKEKKFFDFQQNALQNVLKALWLYYKDKEGKKKDFYDHYKANGLEENLDYNLRGREGMGTAKYLFEYDKDYPVLNDKISFENFINRMSFWMATGSGKTLIIVKLIAILGRLIKEREIPVNDILFLAHRDDLLEQFEGHVKEFNSFNLGVKINLRNLKDYENVKRENALPIIKNEITVFYYRSDLISDEHKEKIVNFRNYDNNGKWYILLDEAHKGDREDSKRQILYSILSRNGFLFNFSATFVDPRDYITCVFNFNLSKFIEEGYGKHIYLSQSEIGAFRNKSDFSPQEKQKIVLKSLLILTYINKHFKKIREENKSLYHRPLLLTLVNSVDTKDSDLKMFFVELEKIARKQFKTSLLREARRDLINEFSSNPSFVFEDINCVIDLNLFSKIGYADILEEVFNTKTSGKIEVLKIPNNKKELIFKLQTAEKPFALIKIGEISGWLKDKLEGYEINESFENESIFKKINRDDSDINILMGSRAFYEGWDSNRPNLILFVNIGVGSDAKKFVLQSIGRGVRIEPQKNKRRRLKNLLNVKEITEKLFNKINRHILPMESLFVFGTNIDNLGKIIKTLKEEKQDKDLGKEFVVNKEARKHLLLVPVYRDAEKIFAEEKEPQKFPLCKEDFIAAKQFFSYIGDKIAVVKYDCNLKALEKVNKSFAETESEKYYDFTERRLLGEPDLTLGRVLNHFNVKSEELDKFKKLEDEIIHFKKIKFSDGEKFDKILKMIQSVKNYEHKEEEIKQLRMKFKKHKDIEKYDKAKEKIDREYQEEVVYEKLKIKFVPNHYYIPLVISENEKAEYINHIINVDSEVKFIEQLEEYITKPDNIFSSFDWWMFSKLDQTLDEVYIPYYSPDENKIAKFKPDFIFWAQKRNKYLILFVDPKGTRFSDYQHKVDGYRKLFEDNKFTFSNNDIETKLFLFTNDTAQIGENYRKYWFDNFTDLALKISSKI